MVALFEFLGFEVRSFKNSEYENTPKKSIERDFLNERPFVFDQQHLLISKAISKQQAGQVKYNTGLRGWGAPKQPGTPGGTKALAR
jgi:hypothetical protein